jgi:hypothetical protein
MDLKQNYTMENRVENLLNIILSEYGVDIFSNSRERDHVEARAIFSKILYSHQHLGYTKIGRVLGKNHATIYHYIKNFDAWIKYDDRLKSKYLNILSVFSKDMEIGSIEDTRKIWYENIILSTKIEKLEAKLSSELYALLDKVPENKAFLVYERLESIIKMNC